MGQRERRHDPYPWTWEIPVAVGLTIVTVLGLGAHLGRAAANCLAGGDWRWPAPAQLVTSVPALLGGHPTAGLPGFTGPAATPVALWSCVAVTELLLLAGCLAALKWGLDRWGPGRLRGMASRAEAERLLGVTRLRRHAPIIRPDLYRARRPRR